ncbi:hypothetical protein ACIGW3_29485 [Streptomyces sp. NPDC053499]|uniref:hypothetical protein n=1 Tax=Streptomyces sp. NPDC053499 TaxID=3365707 RepID=UPI0037D26BEC
MTALVAGNGLGLVWRGYHWPLDVVAGWCLSVLLLYAAAATARRTHSGQRNTEDGQMADERR